MRFSAFILELARDSDKTFNLSTYSNKQYKADKFKLKPQEMLHLPEHTHPSLDRGSKV